jgi:hypothetical protein
MGKIRWGKSLILTVVVLLGILITIFTIQIGVDPSYKNMGTDSGIFAYCGKVILEGGLMYRDCWDNKPPGVYYLNSAAILLGGPNPFSIWLFQAVWLTIAIQAYFLILRKIWGLGLATLAAFMLIFWVLYPELFEGGNLTETYAILPVVLSIGAFWAYLRTGKNLWVAVLGLLVAAGFLLKPTYISMGLAAGVVISYLELRKRKYKALIGKLLLLATFSILPLVLVSLFWIFQHDFYELWFAVFTHNIGYVESGFSFRSLYGTVRMLLINQPMATLTALVIMSYCIFLYRHLKELLPIRKSNQEHPNWFNNGKMDKPQALVWWQAGLGLAMVLDIIFLASSGKNFGHYLQVVLPTMVASTLYLFDKLISSIRQKAEDRSMLMIACSGVLIISLAGLLEIAVKEAPSLTELKTFWHSTELTRYEPNELEQYIIDHSQPSDSVLIWGGHPSMNFLTNRRSPTRYIFLQHLFTPTPAGQNGFSEFLGELKSDEPALIIAQPDSSAGLPFFGLQEDSICPGCDPDITQKMLELKNYVESNYKLAATIWDWYVYERVQ